MCTNCSLNHLFGPIILFVSIGGLESDQEITSGTTVKDLTEVTREAYAVVQ